MGMRTGAVHLAIGVKFVVLCSVRPLFVYDEAYTDTKRFNWRAADPEHNMAIQRPVPSGKYDAPAKYCSRRAAIVHCGQNEVRLARLADVFAGAFRGTLLVRGQHAQQAFTAGSNVEICPSRQKPDDEVAFAVGFQTQCAKTVKGLKNINQSGPASER